MNRFDYLMNRYLEKTETKEELDELMELVASGRHQEAIEDSFAEAFRNRLRDSGRPVDAAFQQELAEIRSRITLSKTPQITLKPGYSSRYKIAAAAILFIMASAALWTYQTGLFQTSEVSVHTVSSSGMQKVLLADGSIVWLKGNSSLTYPSAFSGPARQVSLTGEALFEVARDTTHPFMIDCGDITTTVLGTSFNIRSGKETTEIVVLTGKVSVQSKSEASTTIILPNEKLVYNRLQQAITKYAATADESVAITEGTQYSMSFEDIPMTEVAKRIENKFGITVTMANPSLGRCLITANLTDQSLDLTLDMISKSLRTTYTIHDGHVVFSGPGC